MVSYGSIFPIRNGASSGINTKARQLWKVIVEVDKVDMHSNDEQVTVKAMSNGGSRNWLWFVSPDVAGKGPLNSGGNGNYPPVIQNNQSWQWEIP